MEGDFIYDKKITKQFNLLIDLSTGVFYPIKVFLFKIALNKSVRFIFKAIKYLFK